MPHSARAGQRKDRRLFPATLAGLSRPAAAATVLPVRWCNEIGTVIANDETVIACLELDLDLRLHFGAGIVVLTDRQLLAKTMAEADWQRWEYRPGLVLEHRDHAGLGTLELRDQNGLLARWRHTVGREASVRRLTAQFREYIAAMVEQRPVVAPAEAVCPIC